MLGNNNQIILIRKASGIDEAFDYSKLEQSLKNSGANSQLVNQVVENISNWVFDGVTTKQIYKRAFSLLNKTKALSAIKYKLKQSMFELGPTGYPFEVFIGHVFASMGFNVEVGQVLQGNCVTHEVDVIATKNISQHLVECKYGLSQGKQVSVQVPLYVRSRVNDIVKYRLQLPQYQNFEFIGWVVTNTRFSTDSINYGLCSGLRLMGWDYPAKNSLKEIIEREKLFPVTVLNQLTKADKQLLINKRIVTCKQILVDNTVIDELNLPVNKKQQLLKTVADICL